MPPTTLTDLNQFTVERLTPEAAEVLVAGRLSLPGQFAVGQSIRLILAVDDDGDLPGELSELDADAGVAGLRVRADALHPAVTPGASFAACDEYWYGPVRLVLDTAARWSPVTFVAPDAFVQPATGMPGWREWRVAGAGDDARSDGRVVPGGWDHEHCEVCWRTIGAGGDATGYESDSHAWVCEPCYRRYVGPRDLRFALEGPGDGDDVATGDGVESRVSHGLDRLIDRYDLVAIRQLLREDDRVNVRNGRGWTPLMRAASKGHVSLVNLLLELDADVDAVDRHEGVSALALAAVNGHARVVERLLTATAAVTVPPSLSGGSLLAYVRMGRGRNDPRILEQLQRAGAR